MGCKVGPKTYTNLPPMRMPFAHAVGSSFRIRTVYGLVSLERRRWSVEEQELDSQTVKVEPKPSNHPLDGLAAGFKLTDTIQSHSIQCRSPTPSRALAGC